MKKELLLKFTTIYRRIGEILELVVTDLHLQDGQKLNFTDKGMRTFVRGLPKCPFCAARVIFVFECDLTHTPVSLTTMAIAAPQLPEQRRMSGRNGEPR